MGKRRGRGHEAARTAEVGADACAQQVLVGDASLDGGVELRERHVEGERLGARLGERPPRRALVDDRLDEKQVELREAAAGPLLLVEHREAPPAEGAHQLEDDVGHELRRDAERPRERVVLRVARAVELERDARPEGGHVPVARGAAARDGPQRVLAERPEHGVHLAARVALRRQHQRAPIVEVAVGFYKISR